MSWSAVMATSKSLLPTEEKAYFLKYLLLLTDGGRLVLLDHCHSRSPSNDLDVELSKKGVQSQLKILSNPNPKGAKQAKKVLNNDQYLLLCPPSGHPDTSKFDVSLLYCLLRHVFKLKEPRQQPPLETDQTVEADVYRLRILRNRCGHPEKSEMKQQEFNRKWQELEEILLRLGGGYSDLKSYIDKSKVSSIDPGREKELLDEISDWKKIDEALQTAVAALTSEMKEVRTDVSEMKISLQNQSEEQKTASKEQERFGHRLTENEARSKTLTDQVAQASSTIQFVDVRTKELSRETQQINTRVEEMQCSQTGLLGNVEGLKMDVSNLNQTQNQLKRDVRAQKSVKKISEMPPQLKHLVSMTKMELEEAMEDLTYVETEQYQTAKNKLQDQKVLIISGHPGEGKTTMARKLACEVSSPDRCLELTEPSDWKLIDLEQQRFDTLIIDDIFGAGVLDLILAKEWERCIPRMHRASEKKKINIIITTRHYILKRAQTILRRLPIFKEECVIPLSSEKLSDSEMSQILKCSLDKMGRQYEEYMIAECMRRTRSVYRSSFSSLPALSNDFVFGYPQCVKMFVENESLFQTGSDYFSKPKEFFKECIEDLYRERENFLPLILIWAKKSHSLDISKLEPASLSDELKSIADSFDFCLDRTLLQNIREYLKHYQGGFLDFSVRQGTYKLNHHIIEDMIGIVLCKDYPEAVLTYATRDFILRYVTTDHDKERDDYIFFTEQYLYTDLARQMLKHFHTPGTTRYYSSKSKGFQTGGRCPNKVSTNSVIDTGLMESDAFTNPLFIERFVDCLNSEAGKRLMSTPVITMTGHFLGYGIMSEEISIFLPEYFLQNEVDVLIKEMIHRNLSWGNHGERLERDIALLIAAHHGNIEMVKLLIRSRARVTEETIYIAAVSKHTQVIPLLLKDRSPHSHLESFSILNGNNAIIASSKRGLLESVRALVENGADVNYRNEKGLSALDKAVLFDRGDICEILVKAGAELDCQVQPFKRTPLHTACDKGFSSVVDILLQHWAKTDIQDHRGHYAIHCAAIQGHTDVVQKLLEYDVSLATQRIISYGSQSKIKGMTVFHVAVWKSNLQMLEMLLQSGADPSVCDCYGRTPLYYAAQSGKPTLVNALIPFSSPGMANKQGDTPLHAALTWGHLDVARLLLPNVDINTINKKGETPLHIACKLGHVEMVELLVRNNADVRMKTRQGQTVFDLSSKCRQAYTFLREFDPGMYERYYCNRRQGPNKAIRGQMK